ncbi:MAG TPA: nucleotidyl transferase AbiEii/AbiGii toxin family protein [Spirochaetota bacterium]|nr:nucleotidyl transferase AbiEii/AbiGii toxin family protein [Spirochaetota bacterium]HOM10449.1 nucleotidyl transferase AbiEii/AbiGii toxin family protein [Spirochaetota bacterium]HPP50196.1 nucleotidyl transferase AbiEii/AbiGii toxin family protein [Spirochaetota bacterium]
MEREIDYTALYALQDDVLKVIFNLENNFYITGGTALHRFYYNARYSDDIDLFVNNSFTFHEEVQEIFEAIANNGFDIERSVSTRDFYRIMVDNILRLDFVNDRVYRHGKSTIINSIRVDNKINILTNKITAIINRDEEKDIFDLFCFAYNENFNWEEVLHIANKKHPVEKDILVYRLKTFPLNWLKRIKTIKSVSITPEKIAILCDDIINNTQNSLVGSSFNQ